MIPEITLLTLDVQGRLDMVQAQAQPYPLSLDILHKCTVKHLRGVNVAHDGHGQRVRPVVPLEEGVDLASPQPRNVVRPADHRAAVVICHGSSREGLLRAQQDSTLKS